MRTTLIIMAILLVGVGIIETIEKAALPEPVKVDLYEKSQAEHVAKEKRKLAKKKEELLLIKEGRDIFEKNELFDLLALSENELKKVIHYLVNEYVLRFGGIFSVLVLLTFIYIKFSNARSSYY